MPAPLAKGPAASHFRSSSPRFSDSTSDGRRRPNRPLQTGLIIAASVLVAAGIAIYESPQVRQWVDQSRRKIAVALHSLGDEIQPRPGNDENEEQRRKRREQVVRRNRNELIRKAREEGVAVDLDELARIGQEYDRIEMQQRTKPRPCSNRNFDDLVNDDGMLKKEENSTTGTTTATEPTSSGLRQRQAVQGFASGSAAANPFTDEANVLFDHDDEAPAPEPVPYVESRESTATVEASSHSGQLIDVTSGSANLQPESASAGSKHSLDSSSHDGHSQTSENAAIESYYSAISAESAHAPVDDDEAEVLSTGTLTPRSSRSEVNDACTNASLIGSQADDIAVLSTADEHDARSDAFSDAGFTDAGFSEISGPRSGIMTPSSWTDVGSDDESEFGGAGLQGTQGWGQSTH